MQNVVEAPPSVEEKYEHKKWKFLSKYVIEDGGTPYMTRYTIVRTPWRTACLHHFHRSDVDRCLHDHPWEFTSIILTDGYWEETPLLDRFGNPLGSGVERTWYPAGSILHRPAEWRHRVILEEGTQPWTLVLMGPRVREWGFWSKNGFINWRAFGKAKEQGEDPC